MKQDRFLLIILIFILLLTVTAVGVYLFRQGKQTYLADTTPENIVKNYVLALQNQDYQRAYSYLLETENTPTFTDFQETFFRQHSSLSETALQITSSTIHDNQATLELVVLHGGGSPFGSTWKEYTAAFLVKEEETWKIAQFPEPYWGWGWDTLPYPSR